MKTILVHYNAFNSNQVFQFPASLFVGETVEARLESVFRQCNVVDGAEWISGESARRIRINGRGLRSMSAGDSVTIINGNDWETWSCEGCGWKLIGANRGTVSE